MRMGKIFFIFLLKQFFKANAISDKISKNFLAINMAKIYSVYQISTSDRRF